MDVWMGRWIHLVGRRDNIQGYIMPSSSSFPSGLPRAYIPGMTLRSPCAQARQPAVVPGYITTRAAREEPSTN